MRANDLLEIEERISSLLAKEEKKKGERVAMLKQIQESIDKRRKLCQELEQEKQKRIDNLNKQKEALEKAKQIAQNKENEESAERRERIWKEYVQAIENINKVELVLSKDMAGTVKKIVSMGHEAKASGFDSLAHAVTQHLMQEIRRFIVECKKASSTLRVDRLIGLVKGLNRSIALCESKAGKIENRRDVYLDGFFADLEENFSNHFFSQFETNRLDKPEWYLEYLIGSLAEHETIFLVLSQIDELEMENEESEVIREKVYFHGLIDRIFSKIITKKLKECIYSKSKQQKELIMHHSQELSVFERELQTRYRYKRAEKLQQKEVSYIEDLFIGLAEEELQGIMKKDYTEWSELFMYLIKTIFKQSATLYSVLPDAHAVLLEAAIKKYLEGLAAFLNSFLYQNTEEQDILVHFIEEIAHLEEELIDIETEFGILIGEVTILKVPYLGVFKKDMLDILERVLEEKIETALHPLASYRYMEEQEEAKAITEIEEIVEYELSRIETQGLGDWMRGTIGAQMDRYISENVLSASIEEESDIAKFKEILKRLIEILKQNGIENSLPQCETKCQEMLAKLH
ncbi:uncharacterized protein NESG_01389 [Nematocida ausubeli]|uniref:Exocyst complex component Sec6 n=1 Tax=Nematocida ausubeli (strain ATCC PRA-371 / ERTm2) TaxID=1913371 RepID=A0A086J2A2_NEMA1|nr:uncharacterized protein NESG_01389 [Nematocida ausubeli]KAI5132565.1 hypothetical protein NEAUS06_0214 [Nematocida ausubeli]KFG26270.1 hypothetical protein NESG_01389 [Nematocida ausubeli]